MGAPLIPPPTLIAEETRLAHAAEPRRGEAQLSRNDPAEKNHPLDDRSQPAPVEALLTWARKTR